MKQTVGAVIMTRNCAQLVEGTLKSVRDWVDEIVVIDGMSTDGTVELCRKYGAKVIQNKWDGHRFATERNLGIDHATADWLLHIDPDERCTPELRDAILKIASNGNSNGHVAYEFRKKNFFLGRWMKHGGWFHYSLHFFKRGKARYEGIIHERLVPNGTVGKIEAPLLHYPYESILHFLNRHNGYSSREAAMLLEEKGQLPEKEILHNLKVKPIKRFLKFYVRKRAFLDGRVGLIFSVLYAYVHFLNWAKYWERTRSADRSCG